MACVTNDKAEIVAVGKVDSVYHMLGSGYIDSIANIIAKQAWLLLRGEGITTLVGKAGLHNGRGRWDAVELS